MIPENKDEPVIVEYLTIKDVIELVGRQPIRVVQENKWVRLVFDWSSVRIKVA